MARITTGLGMSILLSIMGSWQFGYHSGVINAPQDVLKTFISDIYVTRYSEKISEERKSAIFSVIVSVFAFAGIFGGLSGGKLANTLGRKQTIILNNIVISVGILLSGLSQELASFESLIVGRLIVGFSCGLFTILVPMYLAEISMPKQRGSIGTLNQLGVTVGLLTAQILGLENVLGGNSQWPYLFDVALVPAFIQMFLVFYPESPRFLLDQNKEFEAREALQALRGAEQTEAIDEEFEAIKKELCEDYSSEKMSLYQLLADNSLRPALVLGVVMQLSQQLSGINSVFYYSTSIFDSAGLTGYSKLATIGVGIVMVIMTIVSIPLMDSLGRRFLHLTGLAGMFFSAVLLTVCLTVKTSSFTSTLSFITALTYVMFFAVGPGSIPWLIVSEIFTQSSRGAAMSIAVFVNWSANFTVALVFPFIQIYLANYSFVPFIILLAIFFVYTYKNLPETKGRNFEEISILLMQTNQPSTYGVV